MPESDLLESLGYALYTVRSSHVNSDSPSMHALNHSESIEEVSGSADASQRNVSPQQKTLKVGSSDSCGFIHQLLSNVLKLPSD